MMCELNVKIIIEELNDFDDFCEELLDRYDECGFDPYIGCYDFDC